MGVLKTLFAAVKIKAAIYRKDPVLADTVFCSIGLS
jgi:hypothetical protein